MRLTIAYGIAAFLFIAQSVQSSEPEIVTEYVASCPIIPISVYTHTQERVDAILKEHGIRQFTFVSGQAYYSVPTGDAARARAILGEATQKEHLTLTITPAQENK